MFTIAKEFSFAAAHRLTKVAPDHKCYRLHGHNYTGWVELSSPALDGRGFVVDFGELKKLQHHINVTLDHQVLNDVVDFEPTAELLAVHIYLVAGGLWNSVRAARIYETPTCWAEYRP